MRRLGLLISLMLVLVPAGLGPATASTGFQPSPSRELHPGVEYFTMGTPESPDIAHVARLASGAQVALRVVNSNEKIAHDGDPLELPSSMCARARCIVGVNADFHGESHEAAGGVVHGGRMLRSPAPGHAQLSITPDGKLVAGDLPWTAAVSSKGQTIAIDGINVSMEPDHVVLYTREWGDRTMTTSGVELLLRPSGYLAALGQPTAVQLVSRGGPGSTVPADGAILSGSGAGATRLQDLWNKAQGTRGLLRVDTAIAVAESVGGNPVLLHEGKPVFPATDDGFTIWRNPRTLVGWDAAGMVYMVTVDGRRDGANGMTMAEAADFLLELGATEGINLDGGGGTTFVLNGSVANHPSDYAAGTDSVERSAVNALVVVPAPAATQASKNPDDSPAAPPSALDGSEAQPEVLPDGDTALDGADATSNTEEAWETWVAEVRAASASDDGRASPPGGSPAIRAGTRSGGSAAKTGGNERGQSSQSTARTGTSRNGKGEDEQGGLAMGTGAVSAGRGKGSSAGTMALGAAVIVLCAATAGLGFAAYRWRRRRSERLEYG